MPIFDLQPGDPTPLGYFTAIWYLFAAVVCYFAARADRTSRTTWLVCSVLMVALGVNKQLDLQTGFTEIARRLARRGHWYDARRTAQLYFIVFLGVASAVATVLLLGKARAKHWPVRIAMAGTIALIAFVLMRAASFHHVDVFLKRAHPGPSWNHLIEVGGITLIIGGASIALVRH